MSNQPKVGIFTYHFADNYGAVLQAYALQRYLAELGCEASFVDYDPDHVSRGGRFWLPTSKARLRANLIIAYQKYVHLRSRLSSNQDQRRNFRDFRDRHLNIAGIRYKTLRSLRKNPPACDAYVCGSDQIWNPSPQFGVDPAYYLDFGPPETKRISYAASFGKDSVDPQYHEKLAPLLRQMNSISTREESGVQIVKKISGQDANWVPDPTLLHRDYSEVTSEQQPEADFIMSYVLRDGGYISGVLEHLSRQLGMEVVVPHNPMKRWKAIGKIVHPGPSQWLGLIKTASLVVTNSFHGTVFCILFQKPFISVGLSGQHASLSERAVSLLGRLGLSDRFITGYEPAHIDELIHREIDWASVGDRLDTWRDEARQYLTNAIFNT